MASDTKPHDPERIYLEPWPYSPEGRLWSEEDVWPLYTWPPEPEGESERATGVEYIRADLHDAEIARFTRELEEARERERALKACVAAEIEHTMHRVTCDTCVVGGECDEEQDLWEKMDQARNLAWELVRPGVTKLRVDAITGALIESTERER